MRSRRIRPNPKKGAPAWMVTYSDLVTLILVFFVLLFSMSQIDLIKFNAIAESFRAHSLLDSYPSIKDNQNPNEGEISNNESEEVTLDHLLTEITAYLEEFGLEDVIAATRTERGVVLVLQEQVLFDSGEASLIDESYPFLDKVGMLLAEMSNLVKVEGHTDNRPITTYQYPSNWELSTARSSSVIRYFIENHQLDSRRFVAVGYGETRPIAPNDTADNLKQNRRVEIIIADPIYEEITN